MDLFLTELVTKVKPNINSVEVHPQLSYNRHPVDGALVGAGSLWPIWRFCNAEINASTQTHLLAFGGGDGAGRC
jgi:hypothetical protein